MKFQNVKFNSMGELLAFLPKEQRILTEILRDHILTTLPNIKEKLSYNVPFYFLNKRIAFIWPGAVPWGKSVKQGVELGFTLGYLLPENNYLQKGTRKEVFIKTIYSEEDIKTQTIQNLLMQSAELDMIMNPSQKSEY